MKAEDCYETAPISSHLFTAEGKSDLSPCWKAVHHFRPLDGNVSPGKRCAGTSAQAHPHPFPFSLSISHSIFQEMIQH